MSNVNTDQAFPGLALGIMSQFIEKRIHLKLCLILL